MPKAPRVHNATGFHEQVVRLLKDAIRSNLIAEVKKDAKKYSYPTGVKYPVTCLYCGKKWLVEMGATNLICSCGNQLHVLERVSRAAYAELKERVTKQIISHYDKWSGAIQAKIKADAEKKAKETEAAAKAAAAAKTSASTSGSATVTTQKDGAAESATSKIAGEKSPENKGAKPPENNARRVLQRQKAAPKRPDAYRQRKFSERQQEKEAIAKRG